VPALLIFQPFRQTRITSRENRFPGACVVAALILTLTLATAGCGSTPASPTPPAPSPSPAPTLSPAPAPAPPSNSTTVSITPFGMMPYEATVATGGQVTFVNRDLVVHQIQGGIDPDHPDCPEIDAVGLLQPGQSRATNLLPTVRTCDYHDHTEQGHHGFTGKIVIR
jgi:plastocyanin